MAKANCLEFFNASDYRNGIIVSVHVYGTAHASESMNTAFIKLRHRLILILIPAEFDNPPVDYLCYCNGVTTFDCRCLSVYLKIFHHVHI